MRIEHTVLLAAAMLGAGAAYGQQSIPDMPGMDHGSVPKPQPKPPKTGQSMPDMPGMQHGGQDSNRMPGDMQHPAPGNPAARRETESERDSVRQQQGRTGPGSDAGSQTRDAGHLQEPENPDFHVGTDAPAPWLLGEVAKRAPLPLQAFLDVAERNPTLAEANAYVARGLAQARQVGLYPNPSAGYQGEQIRGGAYGGGEQGAFVQQSIVLGGKLRARRAIYTREAGADRIGVEEQRLRVRDDVTQAFYGALTAQAIVVERQKLLGVAEDALATAHQLANVGQADAPDVLQAEVEAEQAKVDFVTAQREFLRDFKVLAAYSNQPGLAVAPLAGDLEKLPELDADRQVEAILADGPTVKRAEQEIRVAEARLHDAKREPIPDLVLRAGVQSNRETLLPGVSGAAPVRVGPQGFATAGVDLPLWNRNQGNIDAARAEIDRARQEVARTRLALQREAEPLAQSYLASRFEADRYRDELIPRARRAYELYLSKYQQMAQAYPQVIVSQRMLFQVRIGYLQSLNSVWMNATALQNYTLRGGLEQPASGGSGATTLNLPNGGGSE